MNAAISTCGRYRYSLTRNLGSALRWYRPMVFIMLNPSTADAENDDPTIRRCVSFAKREGATHLHVVNLFALRATDPSGLALDHDPVGPENDAYIDEAVKHCRHLPIVAAWGAHAFAKKRALEVARRTAGLTCLGFTKDGHPRHPLYVKKDAPITPWAY